VRFCRADRAGGEGLEGTTLGQRIRAARRSRRMTQRELGAGTLSEGFISMVEHDRARPSLATLQLLSERLGEPLTSFLSTPPPAAAQAETAVRRGEALLRQHRFSEAVEAFSAAGRPVQASRDITLRIRASLGLGQGLSGLRQFNLAKPHIDSAQALAESSGLLEWRAAAAHAQAFIAFRSRQFEEARRVLQEAIAGLGKTEDPGSETSGKLHALLGRTFVELGLPAQALESFREARAHLSRAADPSHEALLHYNVGIAHEQQGSLDRAREHLERAANLFRMHENLHLLSVAIRSLGILRLHAGELEEAKTTFEQSLHLCEQVGDDEGRAQTLVELARSQVRLGQIDQGRRTGEDALALAIRLTDEAEAARAQVVLAEAAQAQGRLDESVQRLADAVETFGRLKMAADFTRASRDLGFVLMSQGDMPGAAAHFAKALSYQHPVPVMRGWERVDEGH
jgi:tetratricopeptide (TPR) repeat protein